MAAHLASRHEAEDHLKGTTDRSGPRPPRHARAPGAGAPRGRSATGRGLIGCCSSVGRRSAAAWAMLGRRLGGAKPERRSKNAWDECRGERWKEELDVTQELFLCPPTVCKPQRHILIYRGGRGTATSIAGASSDTPHALACQEPCRPYFRN